MKKQNKHISHTNQHSSSKHSDRTKTIRVVCIIAVVLAVYAGIGIVVNEIYTNRRYQELARKVTNTPELSLAVQDPAEATTNDTPAINTTESIPVLAENPIDFKTLQELNPDIVGWITVEGTDIDYPVLFSTDFFYLNHRFDKSHDLSGAIFMLDYNEPNFNDFCSVLYGHNLINGAMFGQLHRFEKQDFFDEHNTISIYVPDRVLTYRIFAAYKTDNLNILDNFDFSTPEMRNAYIEQIYTHTYSHFRDEISVQESDRIITLSTCIGNPNHRYLVQGVLISEEYTQFAG